ncbi:MAG TPA: alpha-L-fucosidase C-terminal domain-containing protein, partial [Acidimicrobiales bacterium]|nr:alpha-L-fucosidase C-terminal domain-containing protein [Acidimicrobiales bacterium]
LRRLGEWLEVNGEAIYGSRPWVITEAVSTEGTPLRFTQSGDGVYAHVMGMPSGRRLTMRSIDASRVQRVRLVGSPDVKLEWSAEGGALSVTLPELLPLSAVTVLDLGKDVRARLGSTGGRGRGAGGRGGRGGGSAGAGGAASVRSRQAASG